MELLELNEFVTEKNHRIPGFRESYFSLLSNFFLSIVQNVVTLCDQANLDLSSIATIELAESKE